MIKFMNSPGCKIIFQVTKKAFSVPPQYTVFIMAERS